MDFNFDFGVIEHLFPEYLTKQQKGRLIEALAQFKDATDTGKWNSKIYSAFYTPHHYDYFLQGDLLREIRFPEYDKQDKSFKRTFTDALILSNTCDLDATNIRKVGKQVVLAPLVEVGHFSEYSMGLDKIIGGMKSQTTSNILYLPPNSNNGKEYFCHLDKAFWFPTEELNAYQKDIDQTRIASLDYFGYYLFLVKLSYHFCRLPEEKQR